MIISVDHGNKSIKTPNALFTSGLIVSEGLQGFKTDYICWNNKYYTLTEQRIAYLRDKTEDERFYSHHGIDFQGVAAAMKDMAVHHEARGASTITQQLVKNMFRTRTEYSTGLTGFIPGVRLLVMKTKEWVTAVKLEMFYTKKEILTMYLNTVDFGSNAFGIRTAAKTYFNTTPMQLKTEESAVLVGMLKATTTYNPRLNPKNSKSRRNVVLSNLLRKKFLTHEEYDSLSELPIELKYTPVKPTDGKAPYFRDVLADEHLYDHRLAYAEVCRGGCDEAHAAGAAQFQVRLGQ